MAKMEKSTYEIIGKIAAKAENLLDIPRGVVFMDLTAAMEGGARLDLERLADFEFIDFAHDIYGINNALDHKTKNLGEFLPRCSY